MTLPINNVHRSRLPLCRTGYIFFAYAASRFAASAASSPPAKRSREAPMIISSPTLSNPIKPSVKPENSPDSATRRTMIVHSMMSSWVDFPPSVIGLYVFVPRTANVFRGEKQAKHASSVILHDVIKRLVTADLKAVRWMCRFGDHAGCTDLGITSCKWPAAHQRGELWMYLIEMLAPHALDGYYPSISRQQC